MNSINFKSPIEKPLTSDEIVAKYLSENGADTGPPILGSLLRNSQAALKDVGGLAKKTFSGVGDFIGKQMQTPEGRQLIANLLGASTLAFGADPRLFQNISQAAGQQYQVDVARQNEKEARENEKAARELADLMQNQKADLDELYRQEQLAIKKEELAMKKEAEKQKQVQAKEEKAQMAIDENESAISAYKQLQGFVDSIDNLLEGDRYKSAVGPLRGLRSKYALASSGEAFSVNQEINSLLASKAIQTLLQMKQQSSTGSTGFGALSERELELIINDIASLNTQLSPEAFGRNLEKIRNKTLDAMSRIKFSDVKSPDGDDPLGIMQ